ncbi:MAG: tetratricopeptide repeat protein, partial [Deltaproteobacteria bacterium]|nr:tetratricopeptide repeat protein [Deltaproteobacteria bacterium]
MNAVRFLFWIPVLLAVILGVVATTPGPARAGESIVPPASRITEHEARLELARLLGENPNHWLEARIQFERILAEDPGDLDAGLGLARLLARQGHARQSRGLVLGLLDNHPDDLSLRLALANVVLTWGDFGLSEDILRDLLTRPNLGPAQQREVLLELARVFVAAQRYEEAGGILDGLLLDDQGDREALTALVGLRLEEKNFPAALALLDHSALLVDGTSLDPNLLRLRSRALAGTGDYRAALGALDARCLSTPDDDLNRAELWLKMNEPDRAQEILTHVVARHPDQIRARLLLADLDPDATKVHTPDFVAQLCQNATSPARLTLWGDEYARVLAFEPARACYQAALDLDPEFFPASLGLIQTEASARRYNASLALLDDLLTELPHTAKLLLLQARVLSWAGRYDESLAAYQALHERWPHDPVPIMESARVAFWAKEPDTAQTLYQT